MRSTPRRGPRRRHPAGPSDPGDPVPDFAGDSSPSLVGDDEKPAQGAELAHYARAGVHRHEVSLARPNPHPFQRRSAGDLTEDRRAVDFPADLSRPAATSAPSPLPIDSTADLLRHQADVNTQTSTRAGLDREYRQLYPHFTVCETSKNVPGTPNWLTKLDTWTTVPFPCR